MERISDIRPNRNRIPVERFKPQTQEEWVVLQVAKSMGETYIDYLKSISDRYSVAPIKNALDELKRAEKQGRKIRDRRSFFNYLIQEEVKKSRKA